MVNRTMEPESEITYAIFPTFESLAKNETRLLFHMYYASCLVCGRLRRIISGNIEKLSEYGGENASAVTAFYRLRKVARFVAIDRRSLARTW